LRLITTRHPVRSCFNRCPRVAPSAKRKDISACRLAAGPIRLRCLLAIFLFAGGCAGADYSIERVEQDRSTLLPLKFESMYGVRDGETVTAESRFTDAQGASIHLSMSLRLGPPPQFTSGRFEAEIDGRTSTGNVECPSLTFLGGQNSLPSIGGVFLLKNGQDQTIYRVTLPPTPLKMRPRVFLQPDLPRAWAPLG
jgi:hypothetical protein